MSAEKREPDARGARGDTTGSPFLSADSDEPPVLSVVLPTKNEVDGIGETLEAMSSALECLDVPAEVIVSDSSSDATAAVARERGATVVEPGRMGYGNAYRHAFERVRGDYVAMADADGTYDLRELPRLLDRLVETDADIVIGSRFAGDIQDGAMPALHRYLGNPALTAFLNGFYDAGVTDAHSGFRVVTADALERLSLHSEGMEFATEMLADAAMRGLTIEEAPITYRERVGESTLDTFADGWNHLAFMLLNAPAYLFSLPGGLAFALGMVLVALAGLDVTLRGVAGRPVWFGVRTMVAGSLLTITGYQIATFGVFSTVAATRPGRTADPVTSWLVDAFHFESGLLFGGAVCVAGIAYAGWLVGVWLVSGYDAMPALTNDVLAFTVIVLGLQTVFASFFLQFLETG